MTASLNLGGWVEGRTESQGATPMRKMRKLKKLYGKKGIIKGYLFTYKTRSHVSQAGFKLTLLWKEFTLTC